MRSLPILPVLPLVLLLACTPSPYRLGVRAANDGRWIDASNHWLTALDNDIYATKPRKALREHAKDAWDERLDIAREHEAARRYAASADAYREMLAYAKSLDEVELLSFSTADATSELKTVISTWAMSERARGSVAHEAGDWAVAVEAFDAARELKGDLVGLDAEQGATFAAWARADLDEHRYHDAADHFRRAFELTGDRELDAWAAAVEVGLGRYALSKNACRAAVSHFEKAGHVVGDNTLEADRARALDCSRLGLLMDPVDDATVVEGRQLSVGTMLLDRIEREVDDAGSRFVRILNPEVLSSIDDPPDHQVRVTIRVNQSAVEAPQTSQSKQVVEGMRIVECDQETLLYSPDEVCTEAVEVEYVLHRTAQTVRLSGAVKLVDLGTGEQATRPIDVQMTHDTTHATSFQLFEAGTTVPVEIGTQASVGRIELPEAIVALDREPLPLPTGEEMLVDAVRTLASEAAKAILDTVDREDDPPAPRTLSILRPVLAPTDMEFQVVQPPAVPQPTMEADPLPTPAPTEPPAPDAPPTDAPPTDVPATPEETP